MLKRSHCDSDGKCFAKMTGGCVIFGGEMHERCGTYGCRWYKPEGTKDWVRLDTKTEVHMYPPEELGADYVSRQQSEGSEVREDACEDD